MCSSNFEARSIVEPMLNREVIHAIEQIGDGKDRVQITEITADDVTVAVSQPFGSPDNQGNRPSVTVCLDDEVIKSHVAIQRPPDEVQTYDAILTISGAPIPDELDSEVPVTIDISVSQAREAQAAECPGCGADLRETFEKDGCTDCGFYFE